MNGLHGKVALITGASSGLGAAAALKLSSLGARVILAARREDQGQAVQQEIKDQGGEGVFVRTDVTNTDDVKAMVGTAIERFGRLDCAVNNAGILGPIMTPTADIDEADWDSVINTNLRAVWICMKYEILTMLSNSSGSIVNISSIYGYKPSDVGHAAYSTSKYGVIGLSKSAAVDYGQKGIRVNVVAPGYTHSEMIDPAVEKMPDAVAAAVNRNSAMNRLGEAAETAEAVAWLCSDSSSFVNGVVLPVDGGDTTAMY